MTAGLVQTETCVVLGNLALKKFFTIGYTHISLRISLQSNQYDGRIASIFLSHASISMLNSVFVLFLL